LSLSGLGSLNHLFARYRQAATRLSLLSCAALIAVACSLHGLRAGLRTAALPLLAAALAFGLLALRGDSFGLFHLLGALLGVCLADDYAHFSHSEEGGSAQASTAIRLSGLSTAASFAVLMLSAIPAVAALGTTVTLIVALALIFVETNLFSLRSDA
jgi:predicted exporter